MLTTSVSAISWLLKIFSGSIWNWDLFRNDRARKYVFDVTRIKDGLEQQREKEKSSHSGSSTSGWRT